MNNTALRRFSKLTCFSTLFLIFAGGMVTSTGSGLAVPDWPLSYGTLFPPMVGGVFYEHGHRMIASFVGFLTLIQCIWILLEEKRGWLKKLSIGALFLVICQGVLGGLTVLYFLPTPISMLHGITAQSFFLLTIIMAYALSNERSQRENTSNQLIDKPYLKINFIFIVLLFSQLIFGALMRHTHSGLAIPDFPTMGGMWIPDFGADMLYHINDWRFFNGFEPVTISQVYYHFLHRFMVLVIIFFLVLLNMKGLKAYKNNPLIYRTIVYLNLLILIQIALGIFTVLTIKEPITTSLHVVNGAATLAMATLLYLRTRPIHLKYA